MEVQELRAALVAAALYNQSSNQVSVMSNIVTDRPLFPSFNCHFILAPHSSTYFPPCASCAWLTRSSCVQIDLLMGAIYLFGAAVYATRIPEKWYPGRFDMFMSSHQIFHVAVVLGAYAHYRCGQLKCTAVLAPFSTCWHCTVTCYAGLLDQANVLLFGFLLRRPFALAGMYEYNCLLVIFCEGAVHPR